MDHATFIATSDRFRSAIWRARLAPLLPGPGYVLPASCFFFVDDERMAIIHSHCEAGSKLSAEGRKMMMADDDG